MRLIRILLVLPCAVSMSAQAAEGLNVAVASNFLQAATEIADRFTVETGAPVNLIPGSTGHLYAQIVAGAPYDVFLAADVARPQALIRGGHADAESYSVYASGYLVLWSRDAQYQAASCYADFLAGKFRYLAIANPDTAPYGEAARKFLQAVGRWDRYTDRLAYGENASQAFQFVVSGNANIGLVAASHALAYKNGNTTCLNTLPDEFAAATSVDQAGVVLNASDNRIVARNFLAFIQMPEAAEFLSQRGYRIAARSN